MPVASGAAGRVAVKENTNISWTPDGKKRTARPVNKNSYLQRYLEHRRKNKPDLQQATRENTNLSEHKNDEEVTEESAQSNERSSSCQDQTSDKPPSEERSKKSRLCVLL